jgi:hypothetical protein
LPKFLEGKAPTEGQVEQHYDSYSIHRKERAAFRPHFRPTWTTCSGAISRSLQAYKDQTGKDLNIESYAPGKLTRAKAAALEYYRQNGSLPAIAATPQQAAKLPHGAVFVTSDGRVLKRK